MSSFMRLLVFFDIPVKTKEERKVATTFRKFLIKEGYYMIQFSVYTRICNTIENAYSHENRLKQNLPANGYVRDLIITEKQFASMNILCGKSKKKDKKVHPNQISLF